MRYWRPLEPDRLSRWHILRSRLSSSHPLLAGLLLSAGLLCSTELPTRESLRDSGDASALQRWHVLPWREYFGNSVYAWNLLSGRVIGPNHLRCWVQLRQLAVKHPLYTGILLSWRIAAAVRRWILLSCQKLAAYMV